MKSRNIIIQAFIVLLALGLTSTVRAQNMETSANPDKVIEMKGTDDLKFTVNNIEARPGQVIKVKLTTVSDFPKQAMAHNFVLLTLDANVQKVASASAKAHDNDYIAEGMTDKMIAYTALAGGGETVSVTFTVPENQGDYSYICSFPGHFSSGMKGTLTVLPPKKASL